MGHGERALAQDVHDVDRRAGAEPHQDELHRPRPEIAPADIRGRIHDDRVPAAALRDERHRVHQLDPRSHGFSFSSRSCSSSHALVRSHAIASNAGPTNRPMNPNAMAPPKTPSTTRSIDRLPALLIRIGLTKLSTELITATP